MKHPSPSTKPVINQGLIFKLSRHSRSKALSGLRGFGVLGTSIMAKLFLTAFLSEGDENCLVCILEGILILKAKFLSAQGTPVAYTRPSPTPGGGSPVGPRWSPPPPQGGGGD